MRLPDGRAAQGDLAAGERDLRSGAISIPNGRMRRSSCSVRAPTRERSTTSPKRSSAKRRASRADYTPSEDDNMLVTGVEGSKYALGYFGFAYYAENKERLEAAGRRRGRRQVRAAVARDGPLEHVQAVVAAALHLRESGLAREAGDRRVRPVLLGHGRRVGDAGGLRAAVGRSGGEERSRRSTRRLAAAKAK